ncbi:MAG: phage baseplate assembly protein V [Cyanobacteriota bacterium]|nr:phage baseplate assembly protein V [Cyanobacteriota bacterium]
MLKFGTITSINPLTARARVQFAEDGMNSYWLAVLQNRTLNDKFYSMPTVGEQVACLMDENSEEGVILGSIYTSEDTPVIETEKQYSANFEDGTFANVDKETQTLTLSFPNIHLIGNITHEGTLSNTDGIISQADITDKKSSMQVMRDIYNPHKHTGNQGSPTSTPDQEM